MGANRKVTEFNAVTSLADSDLLTMVVDGVNVKMTKANFIAGLGVTGSIVQEGAVTGTPILDIDGTVNKIRNLEAGNGIVVETSPENGATIKHAFAADSTGHPLLLNSATASPDIASLVAGEGVELTTTANSIEIEFTGIPTNVVVVNAITDFPAAVSGEITLADDTAYQISGDLSTANRFVGGNNCVLAGYDTAVASLTYTGTGTMFTSTSDDFKLTKFSANCVNGTLLNITSTSGNGIFQMVDMFVDEVKTGGTIGDLFALQITDVAWSKVTTTGILFTGTIGIFLSTRDLHIVEAGTMYDLGSAVFTNGWSMEQSSADVAAGAVFLGGAASSANIGANGLGTMFNTRFSGAGDPLDTITHDDARWQFFGNDAIPDTRADALLSLQGPDTITITTLNTPVAIGAGWTTESASQFTITAGGRATYNGVKDGRFPVTANLACEPTSGTNKDYTFYIAVNGAIITNSGAKTTVSAGGPKNTAVVWQYDFNPGDYAEVWVENNTDTQDVFINNAVLRVN